MNEMRSHLFFKVEIDHDPKEDPRDLATQIVRQIQKVYGVRSAELSASTSEE